MDDRTRRAACLGRSWSGRQVAPRPLSSVVRNNPDATYDYLEFRGIAESSAAYLAALRGTEVDRELMSQAFAYVQRHFPPSFTPKIDACKARWVRLA